jgi:serine/threonine-protein kinase
LREVRISALVRHPNVLEVYDAGTYEDGSPFLAMEKIAGLSLHQQLALRNRLSVEETYALARELLSALVAIGERGIVHRDIKPENLMISFGAQGALQLKLVDFGIALVREQRMSRLTQQGALVGTPHYMAPEQLRCELADVRTDLYAVGVVLYQALTGAMPYDGSDLSSLTLNVLNGKARSLRALCPDCPASLARLVERALARDPERRFQDARSMLRALEATRARASVRRSWIERGRGLLSVVRRAALRPQDALLAAGTVALMALCTSQSDVAEALRSASSRSAHPSGEVDEARARVAVAPLTLVDETQLPPATSAGPESIEPAAIDSVRAHPAPQVAPKPLESSPRPHASAPEAIQRARALQKKGLTLYLHAELDAAYAAYRQATLLAPDEAAAFRGLGLAASRLGRSAEAQRALTRYLELAPTASDARLIRARLAQLISEEATRGLRAGKG